MSLETKKDSPVENQPISLQNSPIPISNRISYIPPNLPSIPLQKHGALDVIQSTNVLISEKPNESFEFIAKSETKKRYIIKDMLMRPILYGFEKLTKFDRVVGGNRLGTKMEYADIYGNVIMKSERIYPCCDDELRFEYPIGKTLGVVTKGACDESYIIRPSIGSPLFQVESSCCSQMFSSKYLIICDGQKVAEIKFDLSCNSNHFMIYFNPDLPVYYKILFMASGFMVDFINTDRKKNQNIAVLNV